MKQRTALVWKIPVRLLHESGEQIPPGDYVVEATYQPRPDACTTAPIDGGAWTLFVDSLVSGSASMRIRDQAPMPVELYTTSAIQLRQQEAFCSWTASADAPKVLPWVKRPGFTFHVRTVTSVAIGSGTFHRVSSGGYGGRFTRNGLVPNLIGIGFPGSLNAEACRALSNGDSLRVRVDLAVYESAEPYGRMFSPQRGDTRLIWQDRLEVEHP